MTTVNNNDKPKTEYKPEDAHWGQENLGEQEANWKETEYNEEGKGKVSYGGGGPNNLTVNNTEDKPMEVVITGNNMEPETHTIPPGGSIDFDLPENFSGRVQKKTGKDGDAANLAEFTFENKPGQEPKLWFNQSDVKGRNSSIEMEGAGLKLGNNDSIQEQIPEDLITYDANGNPVLAAPDSTGDNRIKDFLQDKLREKDGNLTSYVMWNDDIAMRDSGMTGGDAHQLTVSFGDL